MKLLLIGPYPPPHGGISVHVIEARKYLLQSGVKVRVLNTDRRAPRSPEYLSFGNGFQFAKILAEHALGGWTLHLHTNGHNRKSWVVALLCGLAGRLGPGSLLTLHSGMAPAYLRQAKLPERLLARLACSLHSRIIGVNQEILAALCGLGIAAKRMELLPAYFSVPTPAALPASLEAFLQNRRPILSTVLFYRPEYGFDLLLRALTALRPWYPSLGCLVLGSGEEQPAAKQAVAREQLQRQMMLLGDVPHELCLALMARSDAFLRCTFTDGDAVSVREAISLGVPVVASDVGFRPPGTWLFPAGDLNALLAALHKVLRDCTNPSARAQPQSTSALQPAGFHRLLEMYQKLAA